MLRLARNPKIGVPIKQIEFSFQSALPERIQDSRQEQLIKEYFKLKENFPKNWFETNQGIFIPNGPEKYKKISSRVWDAYTTLGFPTPEENIEINPDKDIFDKKFITGFVEFAGAPNPWILLKDYHNKTISINLEKRTLDYLNPLL